MIERFGAEGFRKGVSDLLAYAAAQARAVVRDIPNGEYFFCDYADEDSDKGFPCALLLP